MRRSILWLAFSQGGLFVVQFGGSVVITRLLTPYEMGVYAAAAAAVALLAALRAMGLGSFIIREPELTAEVQATVFTINALLSGTVSVGIIGLSSVGASWLGEPGVQTVMVLLALNPFLSAFEMLPAAMLERAGQFKLLALAGLAKIVLSTAVTIGLALQGWSYLSIAYGNLVGTVVSLVLFNIVGWQYASFRVSLHDWRRITRFGVQLLSVSGLSTVTLRVSDVLIGRMIGLSALGLYSRASGLYSILWDNLNFIVARAVFVDFAKQRREGRALRDTYLRVVAMMTGVLWPVFIGLAILAGPAIHTVYGAEWVGAALPLSLLCVAGAVLVGNAMLGEVLLVSNETGSLFRFELKRSVTGLTLFVLGCLGGLAWAAAARVAEACFAISYARPDLHRLTSTAWADFGRIVGHSALLTLVACAPAVVLMAAHGWSPQAPLLLIAGAVMLGVAGWFVAMWLLRHPLFDEVRMLVGYLLQPVRTALKGWG